MEFLPTGDAAVTYQNRKQNVLPSATVFVTVVLTLMGLLLAGCAGGRVGKLAFQEASVVSVRYDAQDKHNIVNLRVRTAIGRSLSANFLTQYEQLGGRDRWGEAISEVFEEDPGKLVQYFRNGLFEFSPENGIRVRPAWDEIRIDAGLPVQSSLELTISNPYEGTVLGPWSRKISNWSIEGTETGFLDAFNEFDGIGGLGVPRTEARLETESPDSSLLPPEHPDAIRQYFTTAVLEYRESQGVGPVLVDLGVILRDQRYGIASWPGIKAFRRSAPINAGDEYAGALLTHSQTPALGAPEGGILVGRSAHPYAIAYHPQQHLFYRDGWYAFYFDGTDAVLSFSSEGRSFRSTAVISHLQTGSGLSVLVDGEEIYFLYTDFIKQHVYLRIGQVDQGEVTLSDPIEVADMRKSDMAYLANVALAPDGNPWILIRSYLPNSTGSVNHMWLTKPLDSSLQNWTEPSRVSTDEEAEGTFFGSSGSLGFAGDDLVVVYNLHASIVTAETKYPDIEVFQHTELDDFVGVHDYILLSVGDTLHLAYHAPRSEGETLVYRTRQADGDWSIPENLGRTGQHATALAIDSAGRVSAFFAVRTVDGFVVKYRAQASRNSAFGPEQCFVLVAAHEMSNFVWLAAGAGDDGRVGLLWMQRPAKQSWEILFKELPPVGQESDIVCPPEE